MGVALVAFGAVGGGTLFVLVPDAVLGWFPLELLESLSLLSVGGGEGGVSSVWLTTPLLGWQSIQKLINIVVNY